MKPEDFYLKAMVNLMKMRVKHMKRMNDYLPYQHKLDLCTLLSLESCVLNFNDDADLDSLYIHQTEVHSLKLREDL